MQAQPQWQIRAIDLLHKIGQDNETHEQEAKKWPEVLRLMTHPGVGPLTALAFVLIIGTPKEHRQGGHVPKYKGQQKRWPSQIIMSLRI